ncbi:MAG: VWA domain-containing protein [Treponema sp.]|jgi:Ca-activated chloride channel family protein|nr:VWA domain-containing protein [Treponema sp.]
MNFSFSHPWVFSVLAVYIPLIFFEHFGKSGKYRARLPGELGKKALSSVVFFRIFIVCVIIALAGPGWGTGFTVSEYRRGLDVVFAVDVSRSMDIRDAQTGGNASRLERGLSIAAESAAAVSGARFAAVIGRGRGIAAIPLTRDSDAVLSFLETLDNSSMTGRSTNLESLLETALGVFQNSSPAQKTIVLVSDGESHAGIIKNALEKCAKERIIVNTIAVGSDEGGPVPPAGETTEGNPQGSLPGNLQGNLPVISRRDAAVMRIAAEKTGGAYIDGGRENAASALSAHLLSLARETGPEGARPEPKERRTLFVILAIIAYAASKFAPLVPHLRHAPAAVILFVFSFCLQACSQGKLLLLEANFLNSGGRYNEAIASYLKAVNYEEAAPYAEYGLGVTFQLLDEDKAALKRFDNAQKLLDILPAGEHRELRYRNKYNTGIVYFTEGDFHSAASAFKDALREDPRRTEAKRNLELSLMSLEGETAGENNAGVQGENKTRELLFDYLREKEIRQWKSTEWITEEMSTGPDY